MLSVDYKKSIAETLEIIDKMPQEYINKISKKFMNFLQENKSEEYDEHINTLENLKQQITQKHTKSILAVIAYNYWYNEQEKKQFAQQLRENEYKKEEELKKKYNVDNIFQNRAKPVEKTENNQEKQQEYRLVVVEKKKWYTRLFSAILGVFKRSQ